MHEYVIPDMRSVLKRKRSSCEIITSNRRPKIDVVEDVAKMKHVSYGVKRLSGDDYKMICNCIEHCPKCCEMIIPAPRIEKRAQLQAGIAERRRHRCVYEHGVAKIVSLKFESKLHRAR